MFFIITVVPLALIFAAMQFFLCLKSKINLIKFLPVFCSAAAFLLAVFIRGENLLADAVYGIIGQGIFAAVVILWIFGGTLAFGTIIGWAVYLLKRR